MTASPYQASEPYLVGMVMESVESNPRSPKHSGRVTKVWPDGALTIRHDKECEGCGEPSSDVTRTSQLTEENARKYWTAIGSGRRTAWERILEDDL